MCTLSFQPLTIGFALAMNRDEQRTRVAALPPAFFSTRSGQALYPHEPNGGTWIGLNSDGLIFALLNWYEKTAPDMPQKKSRGSIIPALLQFSQMNQVEKIVDELALDVFLPFRLIGLDALQQTLKSWSWDSQQLEKKDHLWQTHHWFSSGYDEPKAAQVRAETIARAGQENDAGTLPWLRRLHQSHAPASGPYAICMHRDDAVTVSSTEIRAHADGAEMSYHPGAPCEKKEPFCAPLSFSRGR